MALLGAPYPIVRHPRGLLRSQGGINQVKADVLILLLTTPGERVFLPDFGTPLKELIFEPNDFALEDKAKNMIINSIKLWEPRIAVSQIEVTSSFNRDELNPDDLQQDTEHILGIKIHFFDPENIQEVEELRLEIPLGGQ